MRRRILLLATLAAIPGLAACEDGTNVNPAPREADPQDAGKTMDAAVDGAGGADAPPSADAGPIRRTILTRSPYGNLEHTDNLLIDGDMEMSAGGGQSPWVAIGNAGQLSLEVGTGGRCRSGLRCLVMDQWVQTLLGYGVAADDQPLEFWLWAKVPGNDCGIVTVYLFPRMTMYITMFHEVMPETPQPNGDGWCRFHAIRGKMNESVGVLVEATLQSSQRVVLDDAVLRPADGVSATATRSVPISKADHARIVKRIAPVLRERWVGAPAHSGESYGP